MTSPAAKSVSWCANPARTSLMTQWRPSSMPVMEKASATWRFLRRHCASVAALGASGIPFESATANEEQDSQRKRLTLP